MAKQGARAVASSGTETERTPVVLPVGPQIRRQEDWLDLPAEVQAVYPGFRFRAWTNYDQAIKVDLESLEATRVLAALTRVVLEHNGWRGSDGQVYPPASDPAFYEAIPTQLLATVVNTLVRETQRLPFSLRASAAPSGSGSGPATNGG